MQYRPYQQITRRVSRKIHVGRVPVGGDAPITVQTMTNTLTTDVAATVAQIQRAERAGVDIVRVSCPDQESALALKDIAQVSVIHRRPKFRAAPETAAQLDEAAARGEIEMVIPYQLHALHGEAGKLTHVEAATLQGETKQIPADVLLPFFGLSMDLGPIAAWGLALERNHLRIDPASCATSTPGIFAIGDIAHYPGKLKLILQGFSEAAMAAHAIHPIVHPDQALHFEYSTTKGVPGG